MLDISDPENVHRIANLPGISRTYAMSAAIQGEYTYVLHSDGAERFLMVVDISDRVNPVEAGRWDFGDAYYYDLVVSGDYAYLLGSRDFTVIDISNPNDPVPVGTMELEYSYYDLYAWNLVLSGDLLYASGGIEGIRVFDVTDPQNPVITAYYNTPYSTQEIAVNDEYIYTADENALRIYSNSLMSVPFKEGNVACGFDLAEPYPNPFNSTTTISYSLPAAGMVSLAVYDLAGREVTRLVDSEQPAGEHEAVWTAEGVSSGVYMVTLDACGYRRVKLLSMIK